MEFFKPGRQFDFMRQRVFWIPFSLFLVLASTVLLYYPGPNYGTDFRGGTEVEVAFVKPVDAAQVRSALEAGGFKTPDVVQVVDAKNPHRFLVRVQDTQELLEASKGRIKTALCTPEGGALDAVRCPENARAVELKFSPGGDKLIARYDHEPDIKKIGEQLSAVADLRFRPSDGNPRNLTTASKLDHKVEIHLPSKGDELLEKLRAKLGAAVPEKALKIEWVGPKAGKQLRDSARNSVAIAIVFIMLYLAFRFDLRFAPGIVVACVHDAMVILGVFVIFRKEVSLSTIAAVLTIVGYSMNDTVVVYDRIRENLPKYKGKTFAQIINLSVSETLSRTILTAGATLLSVIPFLVWGTGVIKDFALAMIVGIVAGTYSSIYVAAPLTEWIDSKLAKGNDARSLVRRAPQPAPQSANG